MSFILQESRNWREDLYGNQIHNMYALNNIENTFFSNDSQVAYLD